MGVLVQLEVGEHQPAFFAVGAPGAAQDCPDPGDHLFEAERLGDVVVTPHGQAGDLVVGAVAGGQEDDRQLATLVAQPASHRETVHVRQHHVEYQQVGAFGLGQLQRRCAVTGGVHLEAGKP